MPAAPGGVTVLDMDPENREVTQEETEEYAEFLGIDLETERHLLWIARQGVAEPPPPPWKACTQNHEDVFYFNFDSGESTWDHPCDAKYRALVAEERAKVKTRFAVSEQAGLGRPSPGSASAPRGAPAYDEEVEEVEESLEGSCASTSREHRDRPPQEEHGLARAGASGALRPAQAVAAGAEARAEVQQQEPRPAAGSGGDAAAGGAALAAGPPAEEFSVAAPGGRADHEDAPSGKPGGGALAGPSPPGAAQPPGSAAHEEEPDDRWQALEAEVASLARSLAVLKDVRGMQQEYLQLLQAGC